MKKAARRWVKALEATCLILGHQSVSRSMFLPLLIGWLFAFWVSALPDGYPTESSYKKQTQERQVIPCAVSSHSSRTAQRSRTAP
jgi:hypothetical protein